MLSNEIEYLYLTSNSAFDLQPIFAKLVLTFKGHTYLMYDLFKIIYSIFL